MLTTTTILAKRSIQRTQNQSSNTGKATIRNPAKIGQKGTYLALISHLNIANLENSELKNGKSNKIQAKFLAFLAISHLNVADFRYFP